MREAYLAQHHPVIRTHPETGERGIYTNIGFTSHILDVEPEESKEILRHLERQIMSPQCRVRWQPDTFVMWDNRSAQHAATNDFLPMHRRMERVTVVGDRPFWSAVSTEELGRSFRSSGSQLTSTMPTSWSSMRWSLDAGPKRADFERGHIASAVFADLDVDLLTRLDRRRRRHPLPLLRRSPTRWAASASATPPRSSPMTMRVA